MTNLVKKGSVKNILEHPQAENYIFQFSDRYSVFDWGEMPDGLPGKGRSLAHMADFFFQVLGDPVVWSQCALDPDSAARNAVSKTLADFRKTGLPHHGLSLVTESGRPISASDGTSCYAVRKVEVLPLPISKGSDGVETYDYSVYRERPVHCLVPLEIIFRFGVPSGSSLFERLNDDAYCRELGLDERPGEGDMLARPLVEFSTKLEASDRYVNRDTILAWSVLTEEELENLKAFTLLVATKLREIFAGADITLWDGKIEVAFAPPVQSGGPRQFLLVDSIGPDELRLTYEGVQLSKETIRRFYRDTDWHRAVVQAKKLAKERGVTDWKQICSVEIGQAPPPLSSGLAEDFGGMYCALANRLAHSQGRPKPFPAERKLDAVIQALKERGI